MTTPFATMTVKVNPELPDDFGVILDKAVSVAVGEALIRQGLNMLYDVDDLTEEVDAAFDALYKAVHPDEKRED